MPPGRTNAAILNFLGADPSDFPAAASQFLTVPESGYVGFPLKRGHKLLSVPHSELDGNMTFRSDVAFNEPELKAIARVDGDLSGSAILFTQPCFEVSPTLSMPALTA